MITLLYPRHCACCRVLIPPSRLICDHCLAALPRTVESSFFQDFRGRRYEFDTCAAPFYYEGVVRSGLHQLKFGQHRQSTDFFAVEMADTVGRQFDLVFDRVVCVPLSRRAHKARGFNQSELLASGLARRLDIPFDRRLLVKLYDITQQHGLKGSQRWGNVFGAFETTRPLGGQCVLLVDDVCTTGATLNECAKMLRLAGAKSVFCIVAAMSSPRSCNPGR